MQNISTTPNQTAAATSFTPSDLVLLNGDQFAQKAGLVTRDGSTELLHVEQRVASPQLGQALLAAAILANEQQGALRLDVRQTKFLFIKSNTLFLEPNGHEVDWPTGSLEARLLALAKGGQNEKNDVKRLVFNLLGSDSDLPWNKVVELAKQGLAERELLTVVEEKKLKVFTTRRYVLPETSRSLLVQQVVAPVQQLLAGCKDKRPQVWQLLSKGCAAAINNRRTRRASHDWND